MDQHCADRGVFIVENLCNLGEVLEKGNLFKANVYPMNYAEMTGLPCRVVADVLQKAGISVDFFRDRRQYEDSDRYNDVLHNIFIHQMKNK